MKILLVCIFRVFNVKILYKYYKKIRNIFCTLFHIYRIQCLKNKTILIEFPTTLIRGHKYIAFEGDFIALKGLRLEAIDKYLNYKYTPSIKFGNNVYLNNDCHIACINKIVIGDNVLIASKVFISDHSHGNIDSSVLDVIPVNRPLISKGSVIIKDNVWIGESVAIMPNVEIGENSIIGCNSVVTKSFPKNSVIAGNPARLIRTL